MPYHILAENGGTWGTHARGADPSQLKATNPHPEPLALDFKFESTQKVIE